jgi:hypothetical protein
MGSGISAKLLISGVVAVVVGIAAAQDLSTIASALADYSATIVLAPTVVLLDREGGSVYLQQYQFESAFDVIWSRS